MPRRNQRSNQRPRAAADLLPVEPSTRRSRLRRGGPRTPLPLLPLITVGAGIGIAYVSQTAHATSSTYQASTLSAQQQHLRTEYLQLRDELARLQSSERIVAAAQQLGMRPASSWAYVAAHAQPVLPPDSAQLTATSGDALQQLLTALRAVADGSGDAGR
ncbi:MAG TPA: FtsL-like putative cell division protein [Candidatus Dormibacteraeota bacterium]|nr:FtsL-like putative cell division protein [Candidatus Dormibacteraeota bacterium]